MILTAHPFQRAGARAAAALCGYTTPAQMSPHDLDRVQEIITADAIGVAHAPKKGPGYAWWLALNAAYPNMIVTHLTRHRRSREDLTAAFEDMFAPDTNAAWHCWLCDAPAARRWGKTLLPMSDSMAYLNTSQGGAPGSPMCRSCRIAVWAMPYSAHHNGGILTTYDSDDEELAHALTRRALEHNRAVIDDELAAWPTRWNTAGLTEALAEHPAHLVVAQWRNDNREPYMYERYVDEATAHWWASLPEDLRAEVSALAHPTAWYLISQSTRGSNTHSHPFTLLHALSSQAFQTVSKNSEETAWKAWRLAEAARLLTQGDYLRERGLDPAPTMALLDRVVPLLEDAHERDRFVTGRYQMEEWRTWFQQRTLDHLLDTGQEKPLITPEQWDLLFGQEETWVHRDLLMTGILAHYRPVP